MSAGYTMPRQSLYDQPEQPTRRAPATADSRIGHGQPVSLTQTRDERRPNLSRCLAGAQNCQWVIIAITGRSPTRNVLSRLAIAIAVRAEGVDQLAISQFG